MRSALIISERFTDYKISQIEFPSDSGLTQALEDTVTQFLEVQKAEGGMDELVGGKSKNSSPTPGKPPFGKFAKKGAGMVPGLLSGSPASTLQNLFMSNIKMILPIAIPLMVVQLIPLIIDELKRPGGFLDVRFRRDARRELEFGLTREQQQLTRIGVRQVIIQSQAGFRNMAGAASTNTLRQIRESGFRVSSLGFSQIDDDDRAGGLER